MTGYESGETEGIVSATHEEEVEFESRGCCEGEKPRKRNMETWFKGTEALEGKV